MLGRAAGAPGWWRAQLCRMEGGAALGALFGLVQADGHVEPGPRARGGAAPVRRGFHGAQLPGDCAPESAALQGPASAGAQLGRTTRDGSPGPQGRLLRARTGSVACACMGSTALGAPLREDHPGSREGASTAPASPAFLGAWPGLVAGGRPSLPRHPQPCPAVHLSSPSPRTPRPRWPSPLTTPSLGKGFETRPQDSCRLWPPRPDKY